MDDSKYEVAWADHHEKYLVLFCTVCSTILIGPVETFTSKQYDEAINNHNTELCNNVNV